MKLIKHRTNSVSQLNFTENFNGVEIDLRYKDKDIILHHDPFVDGEKFEDFLKEFNMSFLILNIKTEGIEEEVLRLVEKYEVPDYFFLDTSIPFMIKYINKGWNKFAVRYSEYEPLELSLKFKDKVEWVWVDCFNFLPIDDQSYIELKKYFKICIVSPELQGHELSMIEKFKKQLIGLEIDAVCTKRPELWRN